MEGPSSLVQAQSRPTDRPPGMQPRSLFEVVSRRGYCQKVADKSTVFFDIVSILTAFSLKQERATLCWTFNQRWL